MLLREFKNLRRRRERLLGFSDLLNYAALVDSGVVLLKDGTLLGGWSYTGPDLNSAGTEELSALSHQVNSALAGLGDGWAINVDLIRRTISGAGRVSRPRHRANRRGAAAPSHRRRSPLRERACAHAHMDAADRDAVARGRAIFREHGTERELGADARVFQEESCRV
jgi:hypothetical protein